MNDLIDAKEIYKEYRTYTETISVLRGIDLTIKKGEILSIVGASGVGKSTFLHILGALDRPTKGKVIFDGEDIFIKNDYELALFRNRKVGFVFQMHYLIPELSALENTMLPALINRKSRKEAEFEAREILEELGLQDRIKHKPGELSGGEQQRVAIARAMILNPPLILLDEPTGNLDEASSDILFDLILALVDKKKSSFLIVTHNEKLARKCNNIYRLHEGRLILN